MLEKIIYIPRDVEMPEKKQLTFMIIWGIASVCFFILINLPSMYRAPWPLYLLGAAPMMIAFNDRDYVKNKLVQDFKSLLYALYKGNIIFMIIYIIFLICMFENKEEILVRLCAVVVFWFLSVPLSVLYNRVAWIITAIGAFCAGGILWYYLRTCEIFDMKIYVVMGLSIVFAIVLSLIISNMQILKHFQ